MGPHLGRNKSVTAIVQARLTSRRLPGKVLLPIGRWTMLQLMYMRLCRAEAIDHIVFAVPDTPANDPLATHLQESLKVAVVRGSEHDV